MTVGTRIEGGLGESGAVQVDEVLPGLPQFLCAAVQADFFKRAEEIELLDEGTLDQALVIQDFLHDRAGFSAFNETRQDGVDIRVLAVFLRYRTFFEEALFRHIAQITDVLQDRVAVGLIGFRQRRAVEFRQQTDQGLGGVDEEDVLQGGGAVRRRLRRAARLAAHSCVQSK